MRYLLFLIFLITTISPTSYAQEDLHGFSRVYEWGAPAFNPSDAIFNLYADTIQQEYYYAQNAMGYDSSGYYYRYNQLIKADINGNILNTHVLNRSQFVDLQIGENDSILYWIGLTDLIGINDTFYQKPLLLKTDKAFNIIWESEIPINRSSGYIMDITFDYQNEKIWGVYNQYTNPGHPFFPAKFASMVLFSTDYYGNLLTHQDIGNTYSEKALKMYFINENELLITGYSDDRGGSDYNTFHLWIDTLGNELMAQNYPSDLYRTSMLAGIQNEAGEIINVGWGARGPGMGDPIFRYSGIVGLISKVDANGTELWYKYIENDSFNYEFYDITDAGEGNYIITGLEIPKSGSTHYNNTLIAINEAGDILWQRNITHHEEGVPVEFEKLEKIKKIKANTFIGVGSNMYMDGVRWNQNAWVVKFDQYGCITENCHLGLEEVPHRFEHIRIYPNPTEQDVFISMEGGALSPKQLHIFDVLGRQYHLPISRSAYNTLKVDAASLSPGMYIIQIKDKEHQKSFKIIKK